jgi:hypothetical protein
VAIPRRESQLSDETRRRLRQQHADAIERMTAAESMVLRGMRTPVQDASDRLLAALAELADDPVQAQRRSGQSIREQQERLRREFAEATRLGRYRSRILAQGQVTGELAAVQGYLERIGSEQRVPLPIPAEDAPELADEDASDAQVAADGMSAAWGAAALGAIVLWRRQGAQARRLAPALRALPRALDGRVRRHAATQAVRAYDIGRAEAWPVLRAPRLPPGWPPDWKRGLRAPEPRRLPRFEPAVEFEPETEIGLPYGWTAGLFEIWSAILDNKTCPICHKLDGTMVPKGKEFPGGYRPGFHANCRCIIVSSFIPESQRARLPGMQIDYHELKEDVKEWFLAEGGPQLGRRHAAGFVRDTMQRTGSPEVLGRKLLDSPGNYVDGRYAAGVQNRRALRPEPVLRQIPPR